MITLYKRGRVWWADSSFGGERRQWSLRTRNAEIAEKLRRLAELELLSGGRLAKKDWPAFEAEFLAWIRPQVAPSTLQRYEFCARHFRAFLEHSRAGALSQISPPLITAYIEWRKQRDPNPRSPRRMSDGGAKAELRHLRRFFSYAVACGYLAKNPVVARNLNSQAGKTMPFTPAEVGRMMEDAELKKNPADAALLAAFLHTGLRISDVAELRKDCMHGERIILTPRKTRRRGRSVALPLNRALRAALDAHLRSQTREQISSPLVFSDAAGRPLRNIRERLERLWTRALVPGGHPHRFRDTFAVSLLMRGASLYDVAKLMGISTQTAERHYAPYVAELQERAAKLVGKLDYALSRNCNVTSSTDGHFRPSAAKRQRAEKRAREAVN